MILLLNFDQEERGQVARQFLERAGHTLGDIEKDTTGNTLRDLFTSENRISDAPADLPAGSAICFSEDITDEEAARIIGTLQEIGLSFDFHVLADEDNLDRSLADILQEHADYKAFIAKMNRLQQLIDATATLKEENYDPDYWSELKFAIADANDFLDAVFAESKSALHQFNPEDVDTFTTKLEKAMKKLLSK